MGRSFISQIHRGFWPAGIKAQRSFVGEALRAFYQEKGFLFHGSALSPAHCSLPSHSLSHEAAGEQQPSKLSPSQALTQGFGVIPALSEGLEQHPGFFSGSPRPCDARSRQDLCPGLVAGGSAPRLCLPIPAAAPGTAHLRQGQGAANPSSLLKSILIKKPRHNGSLKGHERQQLRICSLLPLPCLPLLSAVLFRVILM